MSRYSPTVLPQGNDALARALEELAGTFDVARERRRQERADARAEDAFDLDFYKKGGRRGTMPGEPTRASTSAPPARAPDDFDVVTQFPPAGGGGGGRPDDFDVVSTESGMDVASLGEVFTELNRRPPMTSSAPQSPGAFVPGQGFAGVSRPRFEQIRPSRPGREGLYFDRELSPEGEARADRQATREDNQAARAHEIKLRAEETRRTEGDRQSGRLALEQLRQEGRNALRDKINAAGIVQIKARGEQQRQTNAAKPGAGSTVRPQTAGQRESNAMKMADGVIQAANGSYDDAVDWLTNTPEGQSAGTNGLEKRHLYAALGKYIKGTATEAGRLQTSAGLYTPEESTDMVQKTRQGVTPPRRPAAPGAPAPKPAAGAPGGGAPKRTIGKAQMDSLLARGYKREDLAKVYTLPQ